MQWFSEPTRDLGRQDKRKGEREKTALASMLLPFFSSQHCHNYMMQIMPKLYRRSVAARRDSCYSFPAVQSDSAAEKEYSYDSGQLFVSWRAVRD